MKANNLAGNVINDKRPVRQVDLDQIPKDIVVICRGLQCANVGFGGKFPVRTIGEVRRTITVGKGIFLDAVWRSKERFRRSTEWPRRMAAKEKV